jgi:hypothetical protein
MDGLARSRPLAAFLLLCSAAFAPSAAAAVDAADVADALEDGTLVTDAAFAVHPGGEPAAVVSANERTGGFPWLTGEAAILSTGTAAAAGARQWGDNASTDLPAAQDATVLRLTLDVPAGQTCLSMRVRFLSEEYWGAALNAPEAANDTFLAQVFPAELPSGQNPWRDPAPGTNDEVIAPANFAHDQYGRALSVNGTALPTPLPLAAGAPIMFPPSASEASAGGTVYNGATQALRIATPVAPGKQVLYLSVLDQANGLGDSAVLMDELQAASEPTCSTALAAADPSVTTGDPGPRDATQFGYPEEFIVFDPGAATASVAGLVNIRAEDPAAYTYSFERAPVACEATPAAVTGSGTRTDDTTIAGDGSGNDVLASAALPGLSPNSPYRYRLIATRTSDGAVFPGQWEPLFTLAGDAVAAETSAADGVGTTAATLRGSVRPRAAGTTYWFEYGESPCYGEATAPTDVPSGDPAAVSQALTELDPGTAYHYRLVAENSTGRSYGADMTFVTASPPTRPTGGDGADDGDVEARPDGEDDEGGEPTLPGDEGERPAEPEVVPPPLVCTGVRGNRLCLGYSDARASAGCIEPGITHGRLVVTLRRRAAEALPLRIAAVRFGERRWDRRAPYGLRIARLAIETRKVIAVVRMVRRGSPRRTLTRRLAYGFTDCS